VQPVQLAAVAPVQVLHAPLQDAHWPAPVLAYEPSAHALTHVWLAASSSCGG